MKSVATATAPTPLPVEDPSAGRLSRSEAVGLAVDWCLSKNQTGTQAITDDRLDLLSDAAVREMALAGWAWFTNTALSDARCPRAVAREETPPPHASQGRNPRLFASPLEIKLVGADGYLKTLAEFGVNDLDHLFADAKARRLGWGHREKWAKAARSLLLKHSTELIGRLPPDVLRGVQEEAGKAWGSW